MNKRTINVGMFIFAFLVAILFTSLLTLVNPCALVGPLEPVPPVRIENIDNRPKPPIVGYCDPAEYDENVDYAKKLKVKLLLAGDLHSDEVPYRSGEVWVGLFEGSAGLELAKTSIEINRGKKDELFNTSVSTTRKRESIFLLRDATNLRPGPVQTVFNSKNEEFSVPFRESGNQKTYKFNDSLYILRIENPNPEGFLQDGSALVLENEGREQVIRYLTYDCDDCGWSVDWVGDLDRDGKLDFFLDLSSHYNSYNPTLFLSTLAENGKIVGIFAGFHGVGC